MPRIGAKFDLSSYDDILPSITKRLQISRKKRVRVKISVEVGREERYNRGVGNSYFVDLK